MRDGLARLKCRAQTRIRVSIFMNYSRSDIRTHNLPIPSCPGRRMLSVLGAEPRGLRVAGAQLVYGQGQNAHQFV